MTVDASAVFVYYLNIGQEVLEKSRSVDTHQVVKGREVRFILLVATHNRDRMSEEPAGKKFQAIC